MLKDSHPFHLCHEWKFPIHQNIIIYKYIGQISARLQEAVKKRVTTSDRPIACLLSGGLDSSLITALVAQHYPDRSKLETYSIGLEGSEDLKYAEIVAQLFRNKTYIGSCFRGRFFGCYSRSYLCY